MRHSMKMRMPKVPANGFLMDRKKDGKGNLSVDTRRVTTENASLPDFFETQKDKAGLLACASFLKGGKVLFQKFYNSILTGKYPQQIISDTVYLDRFSVERYG